MRGANLWSGKCRLLKRLFHIKKVTRSLCVAPAMSFVFATAPAFCHLNGHHPSPGFVQNCNKTITLQNVAYHFGRAKFEANYLFLRRRCGFLPPNRQLIENPPYTQIRFKVNYNARSRLTFWENDFSRKPRTFAYAEGGDSFVLQPHTFHSSFISELLPDRILPSEEKEKPPPGITKRKKKKNK